MNRSQQSLASFFALASMAATTACATLFTGTSDTITFESNPAGAEVMIDGLAQGRTPLTLPVSRDLNEKRVTLRLDGYEDRTFALSRDFNKISILNLTNLLGWGIDALTGAIYRYDQLNYSIDLDARASLVERLGVFHLVTLDELDRLEDGSYDLRALEESVSVGLLDTETGDIIVFD